VEAKDAYDTLIIEPKVNYFITNAPSFVSIDTVFGYLSVDASNITTYQTYKFEIVARSATNPNISSSLSINMSVLDTTLNDLFVFDPATNSILKTGVKMSQYLINNNGVLTIPNNILDIPVQHLSSELFKNDKNLKQIILPSTIQSIGQSCFQDATNLSMIQVNSNFNIGYSSFATGSNVKIIINDSNFANNFNNGLTTPSIAATSDSYTLANSGFRLTHNYTYLTNLSNLPKSIIYSPSQHKTIFTFEGEGDITLLTNNTRTAYQYHTTSVVDAWRVC
jgi:hypothetical protein